MANGLEAAYSPNSLLQAWHDEKQAAVMKRCSARLSFSIAACLIVGKVYLDLGGSRIRAATLYQRVR